MNRGRIRITLAVICGLIAPICLCSESMTVAMIGVALLLIVLMCLESVRGEQKEWFGE